jgi:predicted ATPase
MSKIIFYDSNYPPSSPFGGQFPKLILVKDGWNDYGFYVLYNLTLLKSSLEQINIGDVKILQRNNDSTIIPKEFNELNNDFCSLGQSLEYYERLKEFFPEDYLDILNSLNDVAMNSDIALSFKGDSGFNSGLLRFGAAEKAYNEARLLLIENRKLVNDDLEFRYSVKVEGADSEHAVDIDFKKSDFLPFRINVLIGKNGTGKTQYLGSMVNSISGVKYKDGFSPYKPLFNKVISISYSLFDDFPKPAETTVFSYKYIGLRTNNEEIVSDERLGEKLKKALLKIIEKDEKQIRWFNSVNKIINLSNLGLSAFEDLSEEWIENLSYVNAKRLSSGQSIILFILTELIANIEDGSLILFDEPETHLHPSAISELTNVFYSILEGYNSYAIVSTHSPIIIQDIPSKYITIFDRVGNSPIIRKLPLESFGENISTLTNNIFETRNVKELYKEFLDKISDNNLFDEYENFKNSLSLNAQLYLEAIKKSDF